MMTVSQSLPWFIAMVFRVGEPGLRAMCCRPGDVTTFIVVDGLFFSLNTVAVTVKEDRPACIYRYNTSLWCGLRYVRIF